MIRLKLQATGLLAMTALLAACERAAPADAAQPAPSESAAQTLAEASQTATAPHAEAAAEVAAAGEPVKPKAQAAARPASLPLKRGFYVASDTPCGQASNATLTLLRRNGIGGARDFCEFRTIEPAGSGAYRVTQACADSQGGEPEVSTVVYQLSGDAGFTSKSEHGWTHSARHCPQSALPEPWRDNDIRDLID